ncbi:hypothetical protein EV360DRAFT_72372 [Lentinula raphanica]|nr:hypothetical protein EV360DRAFT_72372 [Lentinula raphanica]
MPSKQTRRPISLKSRYNSFFGTSYAPSPSERTELEALISRAQNFLDEHRTLLSPIRRLPIETMAEIFMHCLPTHRYPIRSLKEAPLLLTLVCRKWREIAMTHPPLWSALHIHVASEIASDSHELRLRQRGICGWIARSGALPLSFSLSFDEVEDYLDTSHDRFFQTVTNLSPRLEALHLEVGVRIYESLERLSPQTFPILKRLSLSLDMDADTRYCIGWGIPFVSRIPGMPILSELRINGFDQYLHLDSESTFVDHGSNLTELDLGTNLNWGLPLQHVLAILRGAPKLQHCSVHVQSDSVAQTYETVDLHYLRSLSIRFDAEGEDSRDLIEKSFRSLNCPALKALSVISSRHHHTMLPDQFGFTHLLGFLQHLRMEFPMTDDALVRCLALAPNLTVLEIIDCEYSVKHQHPSYQYQVQDTVLQRLTNSPSSPVVLCPKLETFRVLVPSFQNIAKLRMISFSTLALVELLESRKGTDNRASKLRECTIFMPPEPEISTPVLERLAHLMQDGMRLRVVQALCHLDSKSVDDPEQGSTYHSTHSLIPFDAYIVQNMGYCFRRKGALQLVDNISDSWTLALAQERNMHVDDPNPSLEAVNFETFNNCIVETNSNSVNGLLQESLVTAYRLRSNPSNRYPSQQMRSEYRWGLGSPNQSPYKSLFKTNYAATSSERSELETLIFEAQQELTDLDSDISRMRAVLDGLCARRSQVQEFVDVHRALMAPIRRIPAETLADIFGHCLSTERYPIRSLMEAPLLLTMVCRQWREVAITHPPLWSALHIHVALRVACDAEELALRQGGVHQWIARAGALPLSLSLSLEGRIHTSALNFLTTLMDLSPRLENFDLNVGARMYTLLKNVSPRTFPVLKHLSLNLQFGENHGDSAAEIPFVPRISSDMPMLVGLSIHGFDPTQYLYPAFDGTRNLTELNLGTSHRTPSCIPLEQLLCILIRTPNLKICCASVSGPVAQTYEIVNLNSLHSLCIYFWESRSLQPYHERDIPSGLIEKSFRSLNCPALKALSVTWKQYDFDHNGMDQHHSAFTHLLGSLQHLRLEFTMTDEALMECLALAQNVTVLEIVDWVFAVRTWGAPPGTHRHYYQYINPGAPEFPGKQEGHWQSNL